MMMLNNKFEIGQEVYLKTDSDQKRRIITGILMRQSGIIYELYEGKSGSWHYDFEISLEKDVAYSTSN